MSASTHELAAIPSGTVTFVFTDIEGSTQRWDRDRAAMQAAVRRHDALMRAAIGAHNGYVFKTIGDAFCAAFSKPEEAVAAMFDAQRALAAEDFSAVDGLRVRAAIHTGTADERDRDYFGPAVNRVARLLGITYGGQVLLSGVTSDLVRGSLPKDASLRDLGEHRLKDLSVPEFVHQLVGPDLIADFPPLKSLGSLPNNLPRSMTSFVGRETEIAEITALVERHHLVTLVGAGGIGKTRTSLQVAANLLDGSGDGVWFIELAPLANGEYIPSTIAQALGTTLAADGDPLDALVRALKPKRCLLVFDNCEHLIEATANVLAAILRACPEVRALASSRQALGIAGEAAFRMPLLGVPSESDGAALTASNAMQYSAIALFADRARAANHRFEITDENAPFVAAICRRLDGIALAIELAASRTKMLAPKQLLEKLTERFRVLTGGSRDLLPRQQTLRALIDWSYDLLDESERRLFRRVSIFVNGFTIESVVGVCSDDDLDEFDLFDILASLVEKSLVLAEPSGDVTRYRLLESTRAYAAEKLAEASEDACLAGRHLDYFRNLFVELYAHQEKTASPREKTEAFQTELDDLRVALDGALTRPDLEAGAELLVAIERIWTAFGLGREGVVRIEAFVSALPESESLLLGKLCGILAALLNETGKNARAVEIAERGVAYARTAGDGPALAFVLTFYALAFMYVKDLVSADTALREAETVPGVSPRLHSNILNVRAQLSADLGDLDAAAKAFEQLRDEQRARGNARNQHAFMLNLAEIDFRRGKTDEALAVLRELLSALRGGSEKRLLVNALAFLASCLITTNDLSEAAEAARESIDVHAKTDPEHYTVSRGIELLALIAALEGDLRRAAILEGYATAAFARIGYQHQFVEQITYDRVTALLGEKLSPDERSRLMAGGANLTPAGAVSYVAEQMAAEVETRASS